MKIKTPLKTVWLWLMVIVRSNGDSCYTNGVRLFMKDWNNKTPAERKRLCIQIKEVTENDEGFALAVFGKGATGFFRGLDIDSISY